ncbi:Golgin subfamily A member 5 (Golgin-84), partial [Durusdinium trenchii]
SKLVREESDESDESDESEGPGNLVHRDDAEVDAQAEEEGEESEEGTGRVLSKLQPGDGEGAGEQSVERGAQESFGGSDSAPRDSETLRSDPVVPVVQGDVYGLDVKGEEEAADDSLSQRSGGSQRSRQGSEPSRGRRLSVASSIASSKSSSKKSAKKARSKAGEATLRRAEALEKEVKVLDQQLVHMQQDLDDAQDALTRAKRSAAKREEKLRKQMEQLEASARADEQELRAAIKEKDLKLEELHAEVDELNEAAESFEEDYEALQAAHDKAAEDLAKATTQLQAASKMRETGVQELQEELQATQNSAEQSRREFTSQLREADKRVAELEHLNSELSNEVASLQRKLDEHEEARFAAEEAPALDPEHQADLYHAQEMQRKAEELLAQERRRVFTMQQDLAGLKAEVDRVTLKLEQADKRRVDEGEQHRAEISRLNLQLDNMRRRDDIQGVAALEQRLAALSEHLVAKQKQIELLTSEKGALRQRLKASERQVDDLKAVQQGVSGFVDVESGGRASRRYNSGGGGDVSIRFRRRQEAAAKRIARLGPIAAYPALAEALDAVDQVCLRVGATLWHQPYARLGFLCYIFLLHLWALFILLFHTHDHVDRAHPASGPPRLPPGMTSAGAERAADAAAAAAGRAAQSRIDRSRGSELAVGGRELGGAEEERKGAMSVVVKDGKVDEVIWEENGKPRVYSRRWWVLAAMSATYFCWNMATTRQVAAVTSFASYHDTTNEVNFSEGGGIDLIGTASAAALIPGYFLAMWALGRYGLVCIKVGAFAIALGNWLWYAAGTNFTLVVISVVVQSCFGTLMSTSILALSNTWFPEMERPLATAIITLVSLIGTGTGLVVTPMFNTGEDVVDPSLKSCEFGQLSSTLVTALAEAAVNNTEVLCVDDFEDAKEDFCCRLPLDIPSLNLFLAILTTLAFLFTLVAVKQAPPSLPAPSALEKESPPLLGGIKTLFSNQGFRNLALSDFVVSGPVQVLFYGISRLTPSELQDSSFLMSAGGLALALPLTVVFARLLARLKLYYEVTASGYCLGSFMFVVAAIGFALDSTGGNVMFFAAVVLCVSLFIAWQVAVYEFKTELVFAPSKAYEGLVVGTDRIIFQLSRIVFVSAIPPERVGGALNTFIIGSVIMCVGCIPVLLIKDKRAYARLAYDNANGKELKAWAGEGVGRGGESRDSGRANLEQPEPSDARSLSAAVKQSERAARAVAEMGGKVDEVIWEENGKPRVYPRRWWVLAALSVVYFCWNMAITRQVAAVPSFASYHDTTNEVNFSEGGGIDLIGTASAAALIPGYFMAMWALGRYGLACIKMGAFAIAVGNWMWYAAGTNYTVVMISVVVQAFFGPLTTTSILALSNTWFPEMERPLATAIITLMSLIGTGSGLVVTPMFNTGEDVVDPSLKSCEVDKLSSTLVTALAEAAVNNTEVLCVGDFEDVKEDFCCRLPLDISSLNLFMALLTTLAFFFALVAVKQAPPSLPAPSASEKESPPVLGGIKTLFSNQGFRNLALSDFVVSGPVQVLFYGISRLTPSELQDSSFLMSAGGLALALPLTVVFARLLARLKLYYEVTASGYCLGSFMFVIATIGFALDSTGGNVLFFAAVVLCVSLFIAWQVAVYEFKTELVFAPSKAYEGLVVGTDRIIFQLSRVVFVSAIPPERVGGALNTFIIGSVIMCVGCIPVLLIKDKRAYARLAYDNANGKELSVK